MCAVSGAFALAASGLFVASTVQAATGFGFALIAGPLLYSVVEPSAAVGLVLVLGQVVNLLVLFGELRRPRVDWSAVTPALVAAVPGLPLGALIVRTLPGSALRLAVGLVVCAAVLHRIIRSRTTASRPSPGWGAAVAAGFSVGVLTTSTTTNGPPLAIWLTARRMQPATLRDTVTVIFVVLDVIGIAVLVAVVGGGATFERADWMPLLVPFAIAGHLLGRRVFLRLPARHFEWIVLSIALAAGATSAIASLV